MPRSRRSDELRRGAAPGGWRLTAIAGVAAVVAVAGLTTMSFLRRPELARPAAPVLAKPAALPPPAFVGHQRCVDCHRAEAEAWRGSQHAHAMEPATAETVLGRFDGARFTYNGVTSSFSRKDGRYLVRTDGPDGRLADFEIRYTFGVYPLQQYLVEFPDGRMQALSIAWDARPREAGGERWFHLYPDERIDHADPLHWTRPEQNWNYVCADCHSTNLRRNYDLTHDRYATTWSDLSVACEACHGPGSSHVAWAEKRPGWERIAERKGLTVALDERRGVSWALTAAGNATRSRPLASHREVETCGVCHARRRPIGTDPGPTGQLLDTHAVSLLEEHLYHPDGQQLGEVYTYGSFLQSRMYAMGVTCSDCHDPHTQKLRATGNGVCAQCHAPTKFETEEHQLHPVGSAGARCAACHMPTQTYMVIDPRHDHSIRIPRPDLTVRYGVPNACAACHADRDAKWAATVVEARYGAERKGFQTFTDALAGGRRGAPGATEKLSSLARDTTAPAIARATAVAELQNLRGPTALSAIQHALADADALVRAAALDALLSVPPHARAELAEPLADDGVKALRVKAGRALGALRPETLSPEHRALWERAVAEYVASEEAFAERPEAHLNLGIFYAERGDVPRAEAEYRLALQRQPAFVPAYANLADLYRVAGRDGDAAATLADGLKAAPNDPSLLHALGLARVREGRTADGAALLRRASEARPDDTRLAYVYAVALHSTGKPAEAVTVLQKALERAPYDTDLLFGLSTFSREAGRLAAARDYAQRLAAVAPEDPRGVGLLQQLGAK